MAAEEEKAMTMPLVLAIAATRAVGGIGVGLLLSEKMDRETRRAVGKALLAAGIASTLPLLRGVCGACACRRASASA